MSNELSMPVRITEADLRRARNVALEDAARVVESAHMPKGDGPVMLFEIKAEMAKAIRRLVR